jgi:hypothetical protein
MVGGDREESAHQSHLNDKLAELQHAMDRMKMRNMQRMMEEQLIRKEVRNTVAYRPCTPQTACTIFTLRTACSSIISVARNPPLFSPFTGPLSHTTGHGCTGARGRDAATEAGGE